MAINRMCVFVDSQVHERWTALKTHVSESLLYNGNTIGLQVMLAILMDHWANSPPDRDWLKEQLTQYPARGRPRRSAAVAMVPRVALRRSQTEGHDLFTSRVLKGWKTFCKNCDAITNFSDWPNGIPPYKCPTIEPLAAHYQLKTWTRRELIEKWKFEVDEVTWLPEDPPQP